MINNVSVASNSIDELSEIDPGGLNTDNVFLKLIYLFIIYFTCYFGASASSLLRYIFL